MGFLKALTQKMGLSSSSPSRSDEPSTSWCLPPNHRAYVVGDIHGCSRLLLQVMEKIQHDAAGYSGHIYEIFLGDYIDRGPDSRTTLEILTKPSLQGHQRICLRGNHEEALLRCLSDLDFIEHWRSFGAIETLLSFNLNPHLMSAHEGRQQLQVQLHNALSTPTNLLAFLTALPSYFELGDYYFVHAGIRPAIPLAEQQDKDRLWIRDDFLSYTKRHPKMIIHGHTPQDIVDIQDNRINLDTGAYATGQLACLVLEDNQSRFL